MSTLVTPIKVSALLVGLLLSAGAVDAASLRGVLKDQQNQPLANVRVILKPTGRAVVTDSRGSFVFDDIQTGNYQLDVESALHGHINQPVLVTEQMSAPLELTLNRDDERRIVVTSNPLEHRTLDLTSPAAVLSGEALVMARGETLGGMLEQIPGVNSGSFGPSVGRPIIRGQSAGRVSVLSNQLGSQDVSSTSADHAVAIEPLLAKQIEVLKGPATLLYGSGAVGGVVNVLDNRIPEEIPEQLTGGAEIRLGDSATGERSVVVDLNHAFGELAWHLDAHDRTTDDLAIPKGSNLEEPEEDELHNTNSNADGFTAGLSWVKDWGFVGFAWQEQDNEYGIAAHEHHHHEEHDEEDHEEGEHEQEEESHEEGAVRLVQHKQRLDIKGQYFLSDGFIDRLEWRFAETEYQHQELEGNEVGTLFRNEARELRVQAVHTHLSGWRGVAGMQWSERDFSAIGEEAFIPPAHNEQIALFLIEEKDFEPWHFEWGARIERQSSESDSGPGAAGNSVTGSNVDHTLFSGSAGAIYSLAEDFKLAAHLSRSERAPTLEELFSFGPHLATQSVEIGNTQLDPEVSNNLDLSLKRESTNASWEWGIFYNRYQDYIYQQLQTGAALPEICIGEDELSCFQYTQADARFYGMELQADWRLTNNHGEWHLSAMTDYVRGELVDGGDLPRIPPLRIGGSAAYLWGNWKVGLNARHHFEQDRTAINETSTDGFTWVTGEINYAFGTAHSDWLIFLKTNNLLDETARDHTSFIKEMAPRAGRHLLIGTRVTF